MIKLNVGSSRKIGQPNYGSRGASVHFELELETELMQDPDRLQDRIQSLFQLAATAIEEELHSAGCCRGEPIAGSAANGYAAPWERLVTDRQLRALRSIARRRRVDLTAEVQTRFGITQPEHLLLGEASELIDAIRWHRRRNGCER